MRCTQRRGRDESDGLEEQQVAREHTCRASQEDRVVRRRSSILAALTEAPRHVGHSSTLDIAVDDVVMHDEGSVQQLERRGDIPDGGHVVGVSSERAKRRDDEGGTKPFPSVRSEGRRMDEILERS